MLGNRSILILPALEPFPCRLPGSADIADERAVAEHAAAAAKPELRLMYSNDCLDYFHGNFSFHWCAHSRCADAL